MIRAFQWDLARQVERLDWLLAQLPRYAEWGYQELYLHLEDAIDYPSLPGVARRDAYTRRQFALLVRAAARAGIAVVPIVNLLGHTQYLIKVPALARPERVPGPGRLAPARRPGLPAASADARGRRRGSCATWRRSAPRARCTSGLDESYHAGPAPPQPGGDRADRDGGAFRALRGPAARAGRPVRPAARDVGRHAGAPAGSDPAAPGQASPRTIGIITPLRACPGSNSATLRTTISRRRCARGASTIGAAP